MSRTNNGKKPPGWEYWGKRLALRFSVSKGTKGKRDEIQRERAILKREIAKEPTEPEYHPGEYVPGDHKK